MIFLWERVKQLSSLAGLFLLFPWVSSNAQLIPDKSLGNVGSRVNPTIERDLIEGGAVRNNNLFHSFKEFNVNASQKVYFSNPDGITNILTRVTGSNASKIFGTLGVNGNANLFLINPKGIIFGENAILDISSSFTATTAESIFIDNYEFSAVNPEKLPLLKVNITPGLQYGKINPESEIQNQGVLKVGVGENLTLLGGIINHTGNAIAPSGTVEFSGDDINFSGTVDTSNSDGTFGTLLIDPKNILIAEAGDFTGDSISQALAVNNVVLQANNDITVDDDITGIAANDLTLETGRSLTIGENRNIILNDGSFNVKINDENALPSERDTGIAEFKMNPGSSIVTNGGDINVVSGSFADTSQINAISAGILSSKINGDGGNINLSAIGNITTGSLISGVLNPDSDSSVNAGDISVNSTSGDILTTDFILANSLVKGGNINLRAANNLNLTAEGIFANGNISSIGGAVAGVIKLESGNTIFAQNLRVANGILGSGIANDINIKAKSLILENGSIIAFTFGESKGGNLLVNAQDGVVVRQSNLATNADVGSSGDAGDVTINTKRLTIERIPGLPSPNGGVGIGSRTDANTTGNGGDIIINASSSIEMVGDRPGNFVPTLEAIVSWTLEGDARTGITTSAEGSGISGNLTINTSRFIARDGIGINTVPFQEEGGNLTINANEILLRGVTSIGTGNFGKRAGDLTVNARKVTLLDGASIGTTSFGTGAAGDFTFSVEELTILNGSLVNSATTGEGKSGDLTIKDAKLIEVIGNLPPGSVTDENFIGLTNPDGSFPSAIGTSSLASGDAGNLNITTDKLIVREGGEISSATVEAGAGGNIKIDTRTLQLNDGRINASTTTPQKGGDININASESIEVIGAGFEKLQQNIINPPIIGEKLTLNNFETGIVTVSDGIGSSGNILIQTPNFTAKNGGLIATTTLNQGRGGNITINADNILKLDNSLLNTATFTNQNSGNVNLTATQFTAIGGAQVITNTFGAGKAGNLTVNVSDSIDLIDPSQQGFTSGLFATSSGQASARGGDITVTSRDFNIVDRAAVSVSGEGDGNAGNISIDAVRLFLDNSAIAASSISGEGGNINLQVAESLILRNNSTISTSAGTESSGGGNGGNITFNGGFIVAAPNENSDINANAFQGNGGNINITTPGLFGMTFSDRQTPNSDITASSQFGLNGDFNLDLQEIDITSGLIQLPENFTDASDRISAGCPSNEEARFVTSRRGGLPVNPRQTLQSEVVLQDLRNTVNSQQSTVSSEQVYYDRARKVVEATRWIVNTDGDIEFVADNNQVQDIFGNCQGVQ